MFAVPANRIGYAHGFSGGQLKIIQEIVTLERVRDLRRRSSSRSRSSWRYVGAFMCIIGAAAFMFAGRLSWECAPAASSRPRPL